MPGQTNSLRGREPRAASSAAGLLLAAGVVLAGTLPSAAQIFKLEAGTSTLIDAHGASVSINGDNYESWLAKQGKVFQEKVLGVARRALWQDGKIGLTDLTDGRSIPLTIDELEDEAA